MPSIYLSLRWKALIVLSIVLALVNASLAFLAYRQAAEQFERQQMAVRDRQIRQLQALLDDGYRQMARLANIVPLLGSDQSDQTINERLHHALDHHGFMLDWNGIFARSTGFSPMIKRFCCGPTRLRRCPPN